MRTHQQNFELAKALLDTMALKTQFQASPSLAELLSRDRHVFFVNHGSPLSWIPATCLMLTEGVKAGHGDRAAIGVVDRWFFSNPITKKLAQELTGFPEAPSYEELVRGFGEMKNTDLVIYPEGAYTFFGNHHEIQPFRSFRSLELVIETGTPLILVVHKGTEHWSVPLTLPKEMGALLSPFSKFFSQKILEGQSLNLPIGFLKTPLFKMTCVEYSLELTRDQLSPDKTVRKEQLRHQGEQIRAEMQRLFLEL